MNLSISVLKVIDSITRDSLIEITAYNETNNYIIKQGRSDSLDLVSSKCDDVFWDGGYESLEDVKNNLAADYSLGRITNIKAFTKEG